MMLYHYTNCDFALDDIRNHHMKVATLDSANDPYEWVSCVRNTNGEYYPTEWVRKFIHDRYKDVVGFISFSSKCDDPVMWSHYADKHRGVVLGFECDAKEVVKMHYASKRAEIGERELDHPDKEHLWELFKMQTSRKFEEWIYEDEYRLYLSLVECYPQILNGNKLKFWRVDGKIKLETVILGCDALGRLGEVMNSLRYFDWGHLPIQVACLSPTEYRMKVNTINYA